MKKFKPFIKPLIMLTLGIVLIILFKDKYVEFFTPKKNTNDFKIEYTTDYITSDDDLLYNINEAIDSYIIIRAYKKLTDFIVYKKEEIQIEEKGINENSVIVLMINHNTYNSNITFNIDDKSYIITTTKNKDNLNINVKEKQE